MVHIFGTDNCSFCVKAKQLADQYNIKYQYYDAVENKQQFKELFPNAKTVPQITWNGRYIGGYNAFAEEIENTIGGYGDGKI